MTSGCHEAAHEERSGCVGKDARDEHLPRSGEGPWLGMVSGLLVRRLVVPGSPHPRGHMHTHRSRPPTPCTSDADETTRALVAEHDECGVRVLSPRTIDRGAEVAHMRVLASRSFGRHHVPSSPRARRGENRTLRISRAEIDDGRRRWLRLAVLVRSDDGRSSFGLAFSIAETHDLADALDAALAALDGEEEAA